MQAILVAVCLLALGSAQDPWDKVPEILSRIVPPTFPARTVSIVHYGAVPNDCSIDNTRAINFAIESVSLQGGGMVHVPAGVFMTGAVHLKSNVNLNLAMGATLRFLRDPSIYPLVHTRWEGIELMNYSPSIYASDAENIAITGEGTLDGNADCGKTGWWSWSGPEDRFAPRGEKCGWETGDPLQDYDRATLLEMAENGTEVQDRIFGPGHYLRPQFIQPYRSKNILIQGVRILDSPMWTVHPVLCENVVIEGISINSRGPNSGGVNPESCKDVLIKNVYFDSVGDHVGIKSGRNADGRRLNVPSENIVVQGCTMSNGHGALTIGSEISGGVKNVFFEDSMIDSPDHYGRVIRVKNNAQRGGLLENIYIRNINVRTVGNAALEVDFYTDEGLNGMFVPILRDVIIENLQVTGQTGRAVFLRGYPTPGSSIIENILLKNSTFVGVQLENVVEYVDSLRFENVMVNGNPLNAKIP